MSKIFVAILLITSFVSYAQQPSCEWIRILGNKNSVIESSASCMDNKGNIYATGTVYGEVALSPTLILKPDNSLKFSIFILKYNASGKVVWSTKIADDLNHNYAFSKKIKVDNKGNIYCSIQFRESISLVINQQQKEYRSVGQEDVLLLKLNSKGSILWARHFGSAGEDDCTIDIDDKGNVYAGGAFLSITDFNHPSSAEFDENSKVSAINLFVLKLNTQGSILWVRHMPSERISFCSDIKITQNGDVILTGAIQGKTDFNPGIDSIFIEPTYSDIVEAYLLKLSSDGTFAWVKQLHSVHSFGLSVTTDNKGFIYTSGTFRKSMEIDSMKISADTTVEYDSYFMKTDAEGKTVFLKNTFATYKSQTSSIAVDSKNNAYFSGLYSDTIDSALRSKPQSQASAKSFANAFLYKLDTTGTPLWIYTPGNPATKSIVLVSHKNELFLTGSFVRNFMSGASQSLTNFDSATTHMYIMKIKQ